MTSSSVERVISHPQSFQAHLDHLRKQFRVRPLPPPAAGAGNRTELEHLAARLYLGFPFARPLPEDEAFVVVERGVAAARDDTLAELLVNPRAVDQVQVMIEDLAPDAWQPILARVGRELFTDDLPPDNRARLGRSEHDRPVERELVVGRLGGPASRGEQGGPALRWTFTRTAQELGWTGALPARLVATWDAAEGVLTVRASGLIVLGPGGRLEVKWTRSAHPKPICGEVPEGVLGAVRLSTADRMPPEESDHLWVRYSQRLREGPALVAEWDQLFGRPDRLTE
jgi:hypothetical protein